MKTYMYYEQDTLEPVVKTEEEILQEFGNYWYTKMVKKYGNTHYLLTDDNCIKDWCALHWAFVKHH